MFPFLCVFNFSNAFFHTKKSVNRDLFSLSTPFTCIFNKPDRNQILQARLDRFLIQLSCFCQRRNGWKSTEISSAHVGHPGQNRFCRGLPCLDFFGPSHCVNAHEAPLFSVRYSLSKLDQKNCGATALMLASSGPAASAGSMLKSAIAASRISRSNFCNGAPSNFAWCASLHSLIA